jgi:hypothetical protein
MVRIESSVTSVSWIPLDAMEGIRGLVADVGVGHWDLPPPDQLEDLDELIAADAIRFANELRAWIAVGRRGRTDHPVRAPREGPNGPDHLACRV